MTVQTDINYEYTDTFGGEANYSWCKRGKIAMPPGKDYSDLTAVRLVKKALGLNGVPCRRESYGEDIVLKPKGSCTIVFISFHAHGRAS